MDVSILTKNLAAAFSTSFESGELPENSVLSPEIIDDLFLISDADKKSELPKLMCLAITIKCNSLRHRLLCRLVEFLDVDFEDPERTNDLLKQAKQRIFATYSGSQAFAIWQWLGYLQRDKDLIDCEDQLLSALRYWNNRKGINH